MNDLKVDRGNKLILALINFTSISDQYFTMLFDKCSVYEQQSILKYKLRKDQLRSLLAIMQIKYCFKNYLNWEREVTITKDSYGKPKVVEWVGEISISHTADWIFTGISTTGRIGVDIECLSPFPFIKGSELLFLSEKEISFFQTIQNLEESQDYLLSTWTLKEAYLKEMGSGLTLISPTDLSFNYNPNPKKNYISYNRANGISTLYTYNIDGVAKASVSTSSLNNPSIHFYKHDQQHLLSDMLSNEPS